MNPLDLGTRTAALCALVLLSSANSGACAPSRQDPSRQETAQKDTVQKNTVGEDTVREGTVREGTVREGTVREDTVREDTVREVALQEDAAQRGNEAETKPATAQERITPPPRRKAIGGVASVFSKSTLKFPQAPDQEFICEATFAFPDRARWRIARAQTQTTGQVGETPVEDRRGRAIRYRFGESCWLLDYARLDSQPLTEATRTELLMQLELRRVAMIWPAEFEWKGKGPARTAELKGLGSLHATLDPKTKRPTRLESHNPDGSLRERLDNIQWRLQEKRHWPSAWDLVVGDQVIWHETFVEVKSGLKISESSFLPADRRGMSSGSGARIQGGGIAQVNLPASAYLLQSLEPEARQDWPKALQAARELLASWETRLKQAGHELDPRPRFQLGQDGKPTGIELHLKVVPESLPEGFLLGEPGPALRSVAVGLAQVSASTLRELETRIPDKHRAGTASVVIQLSIEGAGVTQVLLPLFLED